MPTLARAKFGAGSRSTCSPHATPMWCGRRHESAGRSATTARITTAAYRHLHRLELPTMSPTGRQDGARRRPGPDSGLVTGQLGPGRCVRYQTSTTSSAGSPQRQCVHLVRHSDGAEVLLRHYRRAENRRVVSDKLDRSGCRRPWLTVPPRCRIIRAAIRSGTNRHALAAYKAGNMKSFLDSFGASTKMRRPQWRGWPCTRASCTDAPFPHDWPPGSGQHPDRQAAPRLTWGTLVQRAVPVLARPVGRAVSRWAARTCRKHPDV